MYEMTYWKGGGLTTAEAGDDVNRTQRESEIEETGCGAGVAATFRIGILRFKKHFAKN